MRDGIVPLNSNHGVTVLVDNEAKYGETFTYELRSIAGDSLWNVATRFLEVSRTDARNMM